MADPKRPDYGKLANECAANVAAEHTVGNKTASIRVEPVEGYSRSLILGELQETKDPAYRVAFGLTEKVPEKTEAHFDGIDKKTGNIKSHIVPHSFSAGTDEYIDVNSGLKSLVSPITISSRDGKPNDDDGVWSSTLPGDFIQPGDPLVSSAFKEGLKLLPEARQMKQEVNACVQNPAAFAKKSLLPKP